MRSLPRLTAAAAAALLLALGSAACSADSPTASATAPAGSRFDGGITFGSGNFVGTNNGAADSIASTTSQRGGSTFGSGN